MTSFLATLTSAMIRVIRKRRRLNLAEFQIESKHAAPFAGVTIPVFRAGFAGFMSS
jgi:hypothetical protein